MEHPPLIYWADGAGSRAVFGSLQDVLIDLCSAVISDRAIALYRPGIARSGYRVLSDSASGDNSGAMLANEPVALNVSPDPHIPTSVTGLEVRSRLRHGLVTFSSAISIPWVDPYGHGLIVVGVEEPGRGTPVLDRTLAARQVDRLTRVLDRSRVDGTVSLQNRMRDALRDVLNSDRHERLNAFVDSTQRLLGADTAYLALPDDGHSTRYYFASLANVNTPQFRQLKMDFGQGLGGLARTERKTVSTLKYASDERLQSAPVVETVNEGILSAMAAPLVRDGAVAGVLYVGSRNPHPYSETDERVLEEFADYIAMVLAEPAYQEAVHESRSSRLREEFAHAIHDTVVRSLVQIGFTAEQAALSAGASPERTSIRSIQRAAEEALSTLRSELQGLVDDAARSEMTLAQVVAEVTRVPVRTGLTRNVFVASGDAAQRMPHRIGETLIHIGREALTNSMLHSHCRNEQVRARTTNDSVQLEISDDGRGSATMSAAAEHARPSGHFGITSMRRRAATANGALRIVSRPGAGTTVSVEIPRTW